MSHRDRHARGLTRRAAAVALLACLGVPAWAWQAGGKRYETRFDVPAADFPVPFPLSDAEIGAIRRRRSKEAWPPPAAEAGALAATEGARDPVAEVDLVALARERAVTRGEVLAARLGCAGCHGPDLGGAVLADTRLAGRSAAPNLTRGRGGLPRGSSGAEWDRAVRRCLRRDGRAAWKPPDACAPGLTDPELSDLVAWIRSRPPVERDVGVSRPGPWTRVRAAWDDEVFGAYGIASGAGGSGR